MVITHVLHNEAPKYATSWKYPLDGIIFQAMKGDDSYYHSIDDTSRTTLWSSVFKWKPVDNITNDYRVVYHPQGKKHFIKGTTIDDLSDDKKYLVCKLMYTIGHN